MIEQFPDRQSGVENPSFGTQNGGGEAVRESLSSLGIEEASIPALGDKSSIQVEDISDVSC